MLVEQRREYRGRINGFFDNSLLRLATAASRNEPRGSEKRCRKLFHGEVPVQVKPGRVSDRESKVADCKIAHIWRESRTGHSAACHGLVNRE